MPVMLHCLCALGWLADMFIGSWIVDSGGNTGKPAPFPPNQIMRSCFGPTIKADGPTHRRNQEYDPALLRTLESFLASGDFHVTRLDSRGKRLTLVALTYGTPWHILGPLYSFHLWSSSRGVGYQGNRANLHWLEYHLDLWVFLFSLVYGPVFCH